MSEWLIPSSLAEHLAAAVAVLLWHELMLAILLQELQFCLVRASKKSWADLDTRVVFEKLAEIQHALGSYGRGLFELRLVVSVACNSDQVVPVGQ